MGYKPSILFPAILSIDHLHETIDRKHSRKFRMRLSTTSEVALCCVELSFLAWAYMLHAYVCVCLCLSALQGHVQKCHPDPLSQ